MIWIGLAIGFLISGFFCVSAMCLVTAGKRADEEMIKLSKESKDKTE
jgi:hypothetical protein